MNIALAILAAYFAIAVVLAVVLRGRWVEWQQQEYPALVRKEGHHAPGFFIFTCFFWPVGVPMFLAESKDVEPGWLTRRIDRWMQGGAA